jgi:outer membrane protein assembly factor BamD
MMLKRTVCALLLVGLMAGSAQAAWVWTPETRRWINPKYAAKDTPKAQMSWAMTFFERKDYPRAAKEFLRLVRAYPRSEEAPEAQYLAGTSYELMERPEKAFAAYKKLVEVYPFSARFKDTIEREFQIAERFFQGEKIKLMGPVKLPSLDKAIEIYQHVVDQAPYGEYASHAQLRLGECYIKQSRYEEANRAFQQVVDEYPDSEYLEDAKFKIAFCARQLSLKASYDQSATDEAIEWYESFITTHPESDLMIEAKESLVQLRQIKAEGLSEIAHFYRIKSKPKAAAMYYQEILDHYPDTPAAADAVSRLTELEQSGDLDKK